MKSKPVLAQDKAQILVVDDTPANIELLYQILSEEGYLVAAAPSGKIALDIVAELQPDLILLDVMMPGMNGFETCRQLKSRADSKDIPVIFITAKTEVTDIVEGFKAGAIDYINKPIKREEVCIRIETQLKIQYLIKQQKKLLTQLQDYEIRNRYIVQEITDALVTVDASGLIESVNPAAMQLFMYDERELVGLRFIDLMTQEYQDGYKNCFSGQFNQAGIFTQVGELVLLRKDNTQISVNLSIKQLALSTPLFMCHIHDLTTHKAEIKELTSISNLDPLTNIANRRRFEDVMSIEWQQTIFKHQSIAIIMIDIDYFKQYNDLYGHQAGDDCLQIVANAMSELICNDADLLARYGGEEFIIILPDTEIKQAINIAQLVHAQVNQLKLPHEKSSVSDHVTISLGVASMKPKDPEKYKKLIELADLMLYRAKKEGRNRLIYSH